MHWLRRPRHGGQDSVRRPARLVRRQRQACGGRPGRPLSGRAEPGRPNRGWTGRRSSRWTSSRPGFRARTSLQRPGAGIEKGARSGIWKNIVTGIRVLRPKLVVVENVAALRRRGLDRVLGDLAEMGYYSVWTSLRASDVGAPHRRERVFILGYGPGSQEYSLMPTPVASDGSGGSYRRSDGRAATRWT